MENKYLQYVGNLAGFQEEINRICEGVAMKRMSREEFRFAARYYNTLAGAKIYDVDFADFSQFKISTNTIAPIED